MPSAPQLQRRALELTAHYRQAALRRMDRVIVTSRYLEDALSDIVNRDRIVRIPNAADDAAEVDSFMAGVAERPATNILVVGMINENKGQLEFIRSLEQLVLLVPDAVVHFAGRGERIARQLREFASETNLLHRLVFHGHVDRRRLYRLDRECQIVALPTVWPEPFGRVPLEAGLASRPVVAFAVGGLKESIVHGKTGLLVSAGDTGSFIRALAELANDPARRRSLGRRARRHVLSKFTVDGARNQLLDTWQSLRGAA
jgi:glycosyltransferase involved in cell wall biosynthesis